MSKRIAFQSSVIPFPPMILEPGSCQAERIHAGLSREIQSAPGTPEWREEQRARQKAYEQKRREWREKVGIVSSF
jgi:hypothetical protein